MILGEAGPREALDHPANDSLRHLFDDYLLDTDRRELRRGADLLPTTPQVFDLPLRRYRTNAPTNNQASLPDASASMTACASPGRRRADVRLEHDPEKCAAVFRKDHAQTTTESAMTIHPDLIAL
jgi:hypothetical protein